MSDPDSDSSKPQIYQAAREDFEEAYRKGFWRAVRAWLTQSSNTLLPFDEVRKHIPLKGQHSIGLQEVPIGKIVGSVNRFQDFDSAFLPRQRQTRSRWESIDRAQLEDVVLPPIELYKVSDLYFVRDGNHRVSVAREKGQAFIDAEVIELDIPLPLETKDVNLLDLIRLEEKAHFYDETKLGEIRPEANIDFTIPEGYQRVLEHISTHRWFLGERLSREPSWEEAVASWYDEVYSPLVQVIREQQILKDFPGRSEADLYLWVVEHLWYLREAYQEEIPLADAARHFADSYSQRPLRWLLNFLRGSEPPLAGAERQRPGQESSSDAGKAN